MQFIKSKCAICGVEDSINNMIMGAFVRRSVTEKIRRAKPNWSKTDYICVTDLNRFRAEYIKDMLRKNKEELMSLESKITQEERDHKIQERNIEKEYYRDRGILDRISDGVSRVAGSWAFIIAFFLFLIGWSALNTFVLIERPLDPYPYVFLNLILSCVAAIQAPVILMAATQREKRDRFRDEHGFQFLLKTALDTERTLYKTNFILEKQIPLMLELNEFQFEILHVIRKEIVNR